MQKTPYLILIIYILFSSEGFCQNLTLKIDGKTEVETSIIDSLGYIKIHNDFISIKSEVDAVQNILFNMGHIENEVKILKKINDTAFYSQIHLKNKFNTIYIYHNKNDINTPTLNLVSKEVFDTYFILNLTEVENALSFINSEISKEGFPFSKLQLSNITVKDSLSLKAHLTIDSSERKRIVNNIIIKGYENSPNPI